MLKGILTLLIFQFLGECFVKVFELIIPGPVFGMLFLLLFLILRKGSFDSLNNSVSIHLKYLPLILIPAAMGIITQIDRISKEFWAILISLVFGTIIALAFSAKFMDILRQKKRIKMNTNALIEYINTTPLTWLILTLITYKIGIILYEKSNKNTFCQPIFIAYILLVSLIMMVGTSYETYFKSVEIIHFFLGPATVALALPLYNNLKYIKSLFVPIILTLVIAGTFSTVSALFILWVLDAQLITILSMATKSVTAPIAIITAEQIGALPSLAIGFVLLTGIIGALFGNIIFKIMRIKHVTSKGFALGLISHAIGTARAVEINEKAAAFAVLAMGLSGIFAAILILLFITTENLLFIIIIYIGLLKILIQSI